MKLTVELVPATSWGDNLRSRFKPSEWDRLRKACYEQAGHKCEICGGKGRNHPVECHEIWHYDDEQCVQSLKGLIALCPSCHEVKHIGRAMKIGFGDRALAHLVKVNGITKAEGVAHVGDAFVVWKARSQKAWTLDISVLEATQPA
jgi:hypothetical protein